MANNEKAVQTTKDVLMIVGTMIGAVVVLMVLGLAVIGGVALLMSVGTVLVSTAATLLVIFGIMNLLTFRFRALVWHVLWLFTGAAMSWWMYSTGHGLAVVGGMFIGAVVAAAVGRSTLHRCADKALGGHTESYADASGRPHNAINLDVSDRPGGSTKARTVAILIGAALLLIAIMTWGTFSNAFGTATMLARWWGIFFGMVVGYSLVTLSDVLWIESRFKAHVFMQYLPRAAIEQIFSSGENGKGVGYLLQSFVNEVSTAFRDLCSVSVRR